MTNNTDLMKVFQKAFSVSSSIPGGNEKTLLRNILRQYAAADRVSFTEDSLNETVKCGLDEMQHSASNFRYSDRMMY